MYNKVILIGNVGRSPEIKDFDNGSKVASFSLATSERGYTTSSGTQVPERTEWHNIIIWGGLAKVVEQYVGKGSQLMIEGKLRTRSYDGRDGNKRYVTEVYADSMKMLGGKREDENSNVVAPMEEPVTEGQNEDLPF